MECGIYKSIEDANNVYIRDNMTSGPSTWRENLGRGSEVSLRSGRLFFVMAHFVLVKKRKPKGPAESHPSQWSIFSVLPPTLSISRRNFIISTKIFQQFFFNTNKFFVFFLLLRNFKPTIKFQRIILFLFFFFFMFSFLVHKLF